MFRILISASVLAVSIGASNAAPKCPPGEIYRITQKVCMDKADAIRVGIRITSPKATKVSAHATDGAKRAASGKTSPEATSEVASPGAQSSTVRAPHTAHPSPVASAVNPTRSPFGALLELGHADKISVSPETRFSLQLATQD